MPQVLSPSHKAAIARGHQGNHQSPSTKEKISKSMQGKSNFQGKKHTAASKDDIRHERGHDNRIGGRAWIVNRKNKTYRRFSNPDGYKIHKRKFSTESIMTFKDYYNNT